MSGFLRVVVGRVAAIALLLAVGACEQGVGFVRGDRLVVESCRGAGLDRTWEPFAMDLVLMGAERAGDGVILRFSSGGAQPHELDQLVLVVEGYDAVRAQIADHGHATRPLMGIAASSPGAEQVEAGLVLLQGCPTVSTPLRAIDGEVTFEHLGATRGERVRGSMRFELTDDRTGAPAGVGFVAEFDFDVRIGQPYRNFAPATNR